MAEGGVWASEGTEGLEFSHLGESVRVTPMTNAGNKGEAFLKRRKRSSRFGILNLRSLWGLWGDVFRGCQSRSVLLRRVVQAEQGNSDGGRAISIQVKTEALGRDVTAQGHLTEQEKTAWQEPNLHGFALPPGHPGCQMPTVGSQRAPRSSQHPGTHCGFL